ncbi:hypothetical protein ACNKHM_22280 [Shigella sonnei]
MLFCRYDRYRCRDLRVTNAVFHNNIANDGKGGAIYTINNDVFK